MPLVPQSGLPVVNDLERLQQALSSLPQPEFDTRHHFADGMYLRELIQPKGVVVVGKVHKREHFYVILSGDLTVVCDGKRERIKAPKIILSQPGAKRAIYAHENSSYMTVHRVDTTSHDLETIENELVEDDPSACYGPGNILKTPLIEGEC